MSTVGPLDIAGLDVASIGFDITADHRAFLSAAFQTDGQRLDSVNLASGAATFLGKIGTVASIRGIVVVPTARPEPSSVVMLGVGILGVRGYGWRRHKATAAAARGVGPGV